MRSRYSRPLGVVLAALTALLAAVPFAQGASPAPGYERFAGCPTQVEEPAVVACLRSVVKSGHFKMGSKTVPISKPMALTGGTDASLEGFFANAQGGLAPVKQQVPGGVIGLTGLDWLVNFLDIDALQLFAVTELVGKPAIGAAIALPIRVHLINPVLGSKCYVGSTAAPIQLSLTPGTTSPPPPNKPISGKEPVFSYDPLTDVGKYSNGTFVDNSFSAPGANGCVLTLFGFIPVSINGLVNSQSGLPAPAGTNETVQNIDIEVTSVGTVYP